MLGFVKAWIQLIRNLSRFIKTHSNSAKTDAASLITHSLSELVTTHQTLLKHIQARFKFI